MNIWKPIVYCCDQFQTYLVRILYAWYTLLVRSLVVVFVYQDPNFTLQKLRRCPPCSEDARPKPELLRVPAEARNQTYLGCQFKSTEPKVEEEAATVEAARIAAEEAAAAETVVVEEIAAEKLQLLRLPN